MSRPVRLHASEELRIYFNKRYNLRDPSPSPMAPGKPAPPNPGIPESQPRLRTPRLQRPWKVSWMNVGLFPEWARGGEIIPFDSRLVYLFSHGNSLSDPTAGT